MKELIEEDWEIAKIRVKSMPSHIRLAIGGYGQLSKDEIIEHLEQRDEIGKRIVEMQINYLKFFKKEMEKIVNE